MANSEENFIVKRGAYYDFQDPQFAMVTLVVSRRVVRGSV